MAKVTGEGTIVQVEKDKPRSKCRKWQLRVPVGLDPRTGTYKTRTRRVNGKTFTQAKAALRDFIAEIEGGEVQTRSGTTVKECVDDFMARRRAAGESTENTLATYESHFRAVCRHIGYADAAKVTRADLERMYAAMRAGDTASGKPLSGTSLNRIHKALKLVFDDLVADGAIAKNPCVELGTPREDTKPRRALKPEAIRTLLGKLDPAEEPDVAYYLAVSTGMRRGEVCGLTWRDVDIENRVISIRHSYDCFGNLKEPKTKAGLRNLPMPGFVAEALRTHKRAQRERIETFSARRAEEEARKAEQDKGGGTPSDMAVALTANAPVPNADGTPKKRLNALTAEQRKTHLEQTEDTPVVLTPEMHRVNPNALEGWWNRDRKSLGLDGWTFHELRHSYLSALALKGVHPKVMQELAGHASSQITMDIYTHVNMDAKREAADALGTLFAAPRNDAQRENPRRFTVIVSSDAEAKPEARFVPDLYHPSAPKPLRQVN